MGIGLIPPNYSAVVIGSSILSGNSPRDLGVFTPLEEGVPEESLMLMRLDFASYPESAALSDLEKALQDARVVTWPGYPFIVYTEAGSTSVYLAWQKGMAWLPVIIGTLVISILPAIMGTVIWLVLPQSVKDLITSLINMGMMLLMMYVMMSLIKPLMSAASEPKKVEGAKT